MNRTAKVLIESAKLLLNTTQNTIQDAGAAIIRPARNELNVLPEQEQREIQIMQDVQGKLREAEFLLGDLK